MLEGDAKIVKYTFRPTLQRVFELMFVSILYENVVRPILTGESETKDLTY